MIFCLVEGRGGEGEREGERARAPLDSRSSWGSAPALNCANVTGSISILAKVFFHISNQSYNFPKYLPFIMIHILKD